MYAMVKGPGPTPDTSIRYFDTQQKTYRTETLKAGDARWFAAWRAFFPVLKEHLQEKGWWDIAYLGFDEKPEEVMDAMFELINEAGPDYRLVLSGGHAAERENVELVLYFSSLTNQRRWEEELAPMVREVQKRGQMVNFYTACEPRYPNTFIYSPLREPRMIAWIARKYGLDGYLRFIFNAFPDDVWKQPAFKWHSGDMFLVYPGPDGPLDSMRWELLRQGIQDYEAWRIAHEMADFWGLPYHLKQLEAATEKATILDSCRDIPSVADARKLVNDVIREVGSPDEMGKKMR
jgi:sialidase-1